MYLLVFKRSSPPPFPPKQSYWSVWSLDESLTCQRTGSFVWGARGGGHEKFQKYFGKKHFFSKSWHTKIQRSFFTKIIKNHGNSFTNSLWCWIMNLTGCPQIHQVSVRILPPGAPSAPIRSPTLWILGQCGCTSNSKICIIYEENPLYDFVTR